MTSDLFVQLAAEQVAAPDVCPRKTPVAGGKRVVPGERRVGPAQRINPTTQDLRIAVIHGLRRSFLQVKHTL